MKILQQMFGSHHSTIESREASIRSILRDFPWLWAICQNWISAEYVKVSQDMSDLKTILSRNSQETRFTIWTVTKRGFSWDNRIQPISRRDDDSLWAEVLMRETELLDSIHYIVMVDPLWGNTHPTRRITIFRHPEKWQLNELVGEITQLHGSSVNWLMTYDGM